ncbi:MAG: protease complex subunit PrcB family protein [Elusimicrobiota bacterium]|jgi:hypothetical protein
MKRCILLLFAVLAACAQPSGRAAVQSASPQQPKQAKNIQGAVMENTRWQGQSCTVNEATHFLIENEDNWRKLWRDYMKADAPNVDFSGRVAACVFLGLLPTGGHGVEFLPPQTEEKAEVLRFRVLRPKPDSMTTQAFTTPYAIRIYRRGTLPLRLEEVR